jgi:ketosteroid isomerase-like protein
MRGEERLIRRYFAAFNGQDIDAVMACFHEHRAVVDMAGRRFDGPTEVRGYYEAQFAAVPNGRCDLRAVTASNGQGMAESLFHGTSARSRRPVEALGVEVVEVADGKIKEIRDYHRLE